MDSDLVEGLQGRAYSNRALREQPVEAHVLEKVQVRYSMAKGNPTWSSFVSLNLVGRLL